MSVAENMAQVALAERGDSTLGQWIERRNSVCHIRRRLTADECALAGSLAVRDLRGTDAGRKRFAMLFHDVPHLRAIAEHTGETA